ncbi:MAG: TIGR04282 family arsenosugar biosynthesis glycosyltransferase [Alphaproteobacteria bacterium]|nr:TIGR04282 family arsenosugar biosynthesis glycosyltransferase [Alphaproteobacteria bacterium]
MKGTLIVFTRAPRLGGVKRRLAAGIGRRAALRFHRINTDSLIRRLGRDPRWRSMLAVTPEAWRWPAQLPRLTQRGHDLGARMANALLAAPPGPVILVGGDIPGITADIIARAFKALDAADAVFGPARDGGYWLVGVRDRGLPRGMFRDVRWSTEHALADTIANLPAGRRHALVDMLEDVDDAESWRRWREGVTLP